ncbi:hypothetical protein GA0070622_2943 [Micromonospora sediminicola]|uniref:DUF4190 domain-containing protein n=1 Tax=Micromonospora sediminicola TaxID=946078 RepID=A0A1A9B9W1_9ACTN|nr:DUF4190 domain-containing protein [Micromonospora sediminicola]SBT65928.1 hypothetical protein GA0070622_2943 [Micromonospora sediminicola]
MTASSEPAPGADASTRAGRTRSGTAAKTSTAAALALVFGVAALFSVLTAILAWIGVVLAIVGVVLGIVGLKMAARPGVTGRGVAIGGLVLSVIALLLGLALGAGISTFLNNEGAVDRLQQQVDDLRDRLDN